MTKRRTRKIHEQADGEETVSNLYGTQTQYSKKIDGQRYTTVLYPAGEGFNHLPYILDILSSPAGLTLDAIVGLAKSLDPGKVSITGAQLRDAVESLSLHIADHGGADKIRDLLAHTTITVKSKGREVVTRQVSHDFDSCFQGRYSHMLKVLAWVLEVNFAPFLQDALANAFTRLGDVKPELHSVLQNLRKD